MLSADKRLEMPLVLHISDSCIQFYLFFLQSSGLFSHGDRLAQKYTAESSA